MFQGGPSLTSGESSADDHSYGFSFPPLSTTVNSRGVSKDSGRNLAEISTKVTCSDGIGGRGSECPERRAFFTNVQGQWRGGGGGGAGEYKNSSHALFSVLVLQRIQRPEVLQKSGQCSPSVFQTVLSDDHRK